MFPVQEIITEPLLNLWCHLYDALTLPGDSTKAFLLSRRQDGKATFQRNPD